MRGPDYVSQAPVLFASGYCEEPVPVGPPPEAAGFATGGANWMTTGGVEGMGLAESNVLVALPVTGALAPIGV